MTEPARDFTLKSFGILDVKDADKGEVEAIIATLNVVDRDRDVILPGAIADGTKVKISSYGHGAMFGEVPVGKGHLHVRGDTVLFKGRYFLSTRGGAEAFATLKELGPDQEWSFGFRVLDAEGAPEEWAKRGAFQMLKKLDPFEVSPVIVGAGIGTQTVAMKSDDGTAPEEPDPAEREAAIAAKTAADLAAEAEADALRRAEEGRVAERAALKQQAAELYERFQRNLRRFGA